MLGYGPQATWTKRGGLGGTTGGYHPFPAFVFDEELCDVRSKSRGSEGVTVMKNIFIGFMLAGALVVLLGATTNRLNWLTQVLSPGASTAGQIAGVTATGSPVWLKPGTNLTIDAQGNLNAAAATVNFANSINVPGTPNGTLVTFTLPNTPKSTVSVDVNGLTLDPSQFSVSGATLTFVVAPLATDNIQATYLF